MVSPMDPAPRPPDDKDSKVLYVAIGCAVFLVVGLCVASGAGVWYLSQRADELATVPVPAAPPPKPPPQQPGQPGRPIVPGPAPGGPSMPPPPSVPTAPRIVTATVTAVDGSAPVSNGATCNFNVRRQPRQDMPNGYWCNTQIVCAGKLLYGGPNAGFFPCTVGDSPPSVVGSDTMTTEQDTDAAMDLNTPGGTLTIRDDATGTHGQYSVTARIDQVL